MIDIRFSLDESNDHEIAQHLLACDQAFIPPLSERIDIREYAAKLAANSTRFEAWYGGQLSGLIAAYCNASDRNMAFITSVSVLSQHQGKGIAANLLHSCIAHSRKLGFRRMELEVNSDNQAAMALYKRFGFASTEMTDSLTRMTVDL